MKQPGKLDPSFNLEIAYHVSPLGEVSDFILFIYLLIFKEEKRDINFWSDCIIECSKKQVS